MTDLDLGGAVTRAADEVGIPLRELVINVEQALALAYKRQFAPRGFVQARLDLESGRLHVTSTTTDEDGSQHSIEEPVDEFMRTAAATARRAVLGQLRNRQRMAAAEEWADRQGELSTALVDRVDPRGTVHVDLGRIEGLMSPEDQLPGEHLEPGRLTTFVILEPLRLARPAALRVSRSHKLFVQRMLESEVPEAAAGVVRVRAIAREAGVRTKVAVESMDAAVDPVGACVGPKGVRHHALLADLPNEHVDIVPFSEESEAFVAAALGPARVLGVHIDPATRTARVTVPKDQLSLAIGKDGQNARLAAKLTGWRIDIHAEPEPEAG